MERPTNDELAAAGLYDPDDELASERLALIDYLLGLGATIEELVDAYPDLPQVASTRALLGAGERFTQAEAATRAGVPLETCARIWRATGFPDPGPEARVYTDEDVETLRTFQAGAELLGEDVVLQVARVIGSSMARVADAAIAAFIVNVAAPSLEDDPGGLSLARANTEAIMLLRQAAVAMDVIFRRHVEVLQRPLNEGDQRTQRLTVGFADLVDSTSLARQLSIKELGTVLAEFDELVSDVVIDGGGRVVKLIGDEVMYVVPDPLAGCEIALTLAERLSDHPRLPQARGGLAVGAVLSRDGDYFGSVVNLASRVVRLAAPGTVLTSGELTEAVDTCRFASIGTCELKGFDQRIELFEVHRS
ncbi:MAG: adenylate/guanylate cyclase domain-containing protein [Acidimicrobiia bacterium]